MVRASLAGQVLRLELQGLDRLFALQSRIEIPLARIRSVRPYAVADAEWRRALRGRPVVGGTLYQVDGRMLWDVRNPGRTLLIELEGERYGELVVEVADPDSTAARIARALAGPGPREAPP